MRRRTSAPGRVALLATALAGLVAVLSASPRAARGEGDPGAGRGAAGLLADARAAVAAKGLPRALSLFFEAIRQADDYGTKYAIRDEVLALPPVPARPPSDRERATIASRIAEEREKDVAKKAGEFEGKGHRHAARLLHERMIALEGVGPFAAKAHKDAIERIDRFLTEDVTDAERAEAREVVKDGADPARIFADAQRIAGEGRPRVALKVYWAIAASSIADAPLREKARQEAEALRQRTIAGTSPEERAEADVVWEDPHWKGLATSQSHELIFIGAREFVTTITEPDRLRVDLAHVFLGDLVGRNLTADGERLTIYYKERFDFAGGIGGGKRVDIGNKAIGKPIAGGLHYHEISHCVFDVGMAYPGFVEGIANFGATFAFDAMGQPAECDRSIASNRKSFEEDYLRRRLRYWRIQPYGPSCGFLLSPITAGNAEARRGEWAKYREFFRRLRQAGPDEPRDAERIRYFAWHWGEVFGWDLLEKAGIARFPVVPGDRERVKEEYERWLALADRAETYAEAGWCEEDMGPLAEEAKDMPPSELRDRMRFALARCRETLNDATGRDALLGSLGAITRWKLCGPFYSRGASPLFAVHEPERGIDLAAEYGNPIQNAIWKDAHPKWDGFVDLIDHGFAYPDDAACYALCELEVPAEVSDAAFFFGFDDTCALWVNGELVEKWDAPHAWVRDHHVGFATLRAGRNRVLLKVANRNGAWSFSGRVVHADRSPIAGLKVLDPPAKDVPAASPEPKGTAVFTEDFERQKFLVKSRHKITVGKWEVDQKCLRETMGGAVLWRKFTIAPGLDKDPPAALLWLVDKDLVGLANFAVDVDVHLPRPGRPKVAVTLHGEERDDGLSGHTFVVLPNGDGVEVRLEEYDRLVYWGRVDLPAAPDHVLRFARRGRTLSCWVDGKAVIDAVDLPALPKSGIGLMTWIKETGISRIRVERLR